MSGVQRERHAGLDGLRGLAALVVFVGHAVGMAPRERVPALVAETPLHALWDGSAAVLLFFVLSGFVLALPFVGGGTQPLRTRDFLVKRILRIYPAYWLALALALGLERWVYFRPALEGASPWFMHFWKAPPTLRDLVDHVIMIGPSFDTGRIDCVIWSLVVELRLSLVYPLVVVALQRCQRAPAALALLAISVALAFSIATLTYLPMFVMGGLVARHRQTLFERVRALPSAIVAALAVAGVLLFDVRFAFGPTPLPYRVTDYLIALGSLVLVVIVAARPAAGRLLSCRPIALLGEVSYSFYLVHFPILLATASLVGRLPHGLWLAPPLALSLSLVTSWIAYRAVEKPFIALGRALTRPVPMFATSPC